jgi:hypothetical protein
MLNVLIVALVIHACVFVPAVLITAVRYDAGKRAGQRRGSPGRPDETARRRAGGLK